MKRAELIREERGQTVEQFSLSLGFSASAYRQALSRKIMSRWMAKEISQRFGVPLEELR